MYVKRLYYDNYDGVSAEEQSLYNPTWTEIENIIDRLDGKVITQIIMDNGDEDNYLCIGGGNNELCNVYISEDDNEKITQLLNENGECGIVHQLVTGGQIGDFADEICVPICVAKEVAKKFCETGIKDNVYKWDK